LSCTFTENTANAYFDQELDALRAAEFESHMEICPDCKASLQGMQSLRTRLRENDLYEHASTRLHYTVEKLIAGGDKSPRLSRRLLPRLWLPAFAILALIATVSLAFLLSSSRQPERVTAELIDAHIRSLQPGHLTDVQSTDQHTVKPWFDGKLDFIPPVADYATQGFPLLGGRLDVIDGHDVAALVYGRRKHLMNLFVWPARNSENVSGNKGSNRGYNWMMWRSGDMNYFLVSDTSAADLRDFKDLLHP
jgi:anti-sigma factor RsiW